MAPKRQLMYAFISMTTDWFEFIDRLVPWREGEMTRLVIHPERTSETPAGIPAEIPLDWWIHIGGYPRAQLDAALDAESKFKFRLEMKPDPVLKFEIESWLDVGSRRSKSVEVSMPAVIRAAWLKEVPFLRNLSVKENEGETALGLIWQNRLGFEPEIETSEKREFLVQMREADVDVGEPPWILWSRYMAWRRRRSTFAPTPFFEALDFRLTFVRVALSPQDEVGECESLEPHTLMVNPTFEYVRRAEIETSLLALARQGDVVMHRGLSALEAAIIDHVRESFRATRAMTLAAVSSETGVRKEFVNAAIERLVGDSYLMAKIGDGGQA